MKAVVLAIGGLDPGGGAGLAADIRAIARGGAFAGPVAAVLTIQSTNGLRRVIPVPAATWRAQAEEVLLHQNVRALKFGALASAANVRAARDLARASRLPVVVDPVIAPTRGKERLLDRSAMKALHELISEATIVTPNIGEAEAILGRRIEDLEAAKEAALALASLGSRAVLLKGGHLAGARAVDILVIGKKSKLLSRRRLMLPPLHGGGCTLASLIAAGLARAQSPLTAPAIERAVRRARVQHRAALVRAIDVGGKLHVLE